MGYGGAIIFNSLHFYSMSPNLLNIVAKWNLFYTLKPLKRAERMLKENLISLKIQPWNL